jgi:Arc/MetJ family transcription regulator
MPTGVDPDLHDVAHLVHEEFDEHLDPRTIDECLDQVAARFNGATVRTFVPLLVRRYVREELQGRLRQT